MVHSKNNTILKMIKGEEAIRIPVWFIQQTSRSQSEYRKLKEKYSLFGITHQLELCAYVTHLPADNYHADAAILYKDITIPLKPIGADIEIKSGIGPVVHNPIKTIRDVEKLSQIDPEWDVPYILGTIKLLTEEKLNVSLIGFTGAPFTLASYMIEGRPSKNYSFTKTIVYRGEAAWFTLMDHLVDVSVKYVTAQVEAGAELIQVFDPWIDALNVGDYRRYVKPHMIRLVNKVKEEHDVPVILFGVGANHLINEWNDLPIGVLGLGWRTSINQAQQLSVTKTLQNNLDPSILLVPWNVIEERSEPILDQGVENGKHVFNLRYGAFPEVQPETLRKVSGFVHAYTQR